MRVQEKEEGIISASLRNPKKKIYLSIHLTIHPWMDIYGTMT
jgi:hypothetical protein